MSAIIDDLDSIIYCVMISILATSERQLMREVMFSLLHTDSQLDLLFGLCLIDVIYVSYDLLHVFNSFMDGKYGEQFQSSLFVSLYGISS